MCKAKTRRNSTSLRYGRGAEMERIEKRKRQQEIKRQEEDRLDRYFCSDLEIRGEIQSTREKDKDRKLEMYL